MDLRRRRAGLRDRPPLRGRSSVALLAAALLAFNPAAIFVSVVLGPGRLGLVGAGAARAVVRAARRRRRGRKTVPRLVWAWLAFGFSLLIKPQAATIGLLLAGLPVRDDRRGGAAAPAGRHRRPACLAALVLAYAVGRAVRGRRQPAATCSAGCSAATPSAAASTRTTRSTRSTCTRCASRSGSPTRSRWSSSARRSGSLSLWGIVLVLASTALVVGRYLQRRDDRALLEGAMIVALAFFSPRHAHARALRLRRVPAGDAADRLRPRRAVVGAAC